VASRHGGEGSYEQPWKQSFLVYLTATQLVYFGFPCQSLFHQFLHNHHHLSIIRGWYNRPVSGRSTQSPTAQINKTKQTDRLTAGRNITLTLNVSAGSQLTVAVAEAVDN
jgi:hypothetical protein